MPRSLVRVSWTGTGGAERVLLEGTDHEGEWIQLHACHPLRALLEGARSNLNLVLSASHPKAPTGGLSLTRYRASALG